MLLLHGWPYDIHSYVAVAPALAEQGLRVIVPYLRGYGTTRFLSDETIRNGQQSALAVDTIELLDAKYSHRTIEGGIGHNLPQEAPEAFAPAIVDVGGAK